MTLFESRLKKEPFISLKAFCYPMTWSILLLLSGMAVLQASAHVLQPVFMNAVAGYDYFTIVHFNYPELYGIIMGAILAFFALVRLKWRMKVFFFVCFVLVTFYLIASYFLIDPSTEAWQFYLPLFALGAAEVMMEIGATFILSHSIPFPHFFMNISIIGFVRCGVGTAGAGAIVERLFAWSMNKHVMLSSSSPDFVDYAGTAWMDRYFTEQNLMLSVKECFGYLALLGLVMLLIVLLSKYSNNMVRFVPKIVSVARWIRNPRHTADPTLS